MEFDILDRERACFLDTPSRREITRNLHVCSVPVLAEGSFFQIEASWEENQRRHAERKASVPQTVIEGLPDRLEPPERWEAQQVDWICLQ